MNQIKIGKFIASCRKEQGMTQANLAEKLGITDRAVSKWENDCMNCGIKRYIPRRSCRGFGCFQTVDF